MGIAFVFIFHLIAIFILSAIVAVISSTIVFFVVKKERRKKRILIAVISPFIGFYTLYLFAVAGSFVVSIEKDVDIGIGDTWYVPLDDNAKLVFIDIPELGYIEHKGYTVISDVAYLQQDNNVVHGKTENDRYFSYNATTKEFREFANSQEFYSQNKEVKPAFKTAINFYYDRKDEIAGFEFTLVGVISLCISIAAVLLTRKIIFLILSKRNDHFHSPQTRHLPQPPR